MGFVGGQLQLQAEYMRRVLGVDPRRCLAVPVDVGKASAMALVADHDGEVVAPCFVFDLTERGFARLAQVIERSRDERHSVVCRVGVEAAGHYHRTLVARLRSGGFEVVELNPATVKQARPAPPGPAQVRPARPGAMAELLVRGGGRPPQQRSEAMAEQVAWVAHRRRKVAVYKGLRQQIHAQLDLVFPGLAACFSNLLDARSGRVILAEIPDPARVLRLGVEGLRRFVARRGLRLSRTRSDVDSSSASSSPSG